MTTVLEQFRFKEGVTPPLCPVCQTWMSQISMELEEGFTIHTCGYCPEGHCTYYAGWGFAGERIGDKVWTWKEPEGICARRKRLKERVQVVKEIEKELEDQNNS